MKKRNVTRTVIQVFIALFFLYVVIAPIITMFTRITPQSFQSLTSSSDFVPSIINSITTALTATVISMLLALGASFSLCRTDIRGKGVFSILFVIPMLIPSISHAYGLKALIGVNGSGILANLLGLNISVLGFGGIVAGSVMYSFPVAFLMLQSILQYEDGMPYKAAAVLGIPPYRRFFGITLPYMRKTLISMFFAVFTMIITDYGVPEALHNRDFGYTLSILMLRDVENSNYGNSGIVGVMLLVPAVVAFAVDMLVPELSSAGFVSEPVEQSKSKLSKALAYIFCIVLSVMILMPIGAFMVQVFSKSYPTDMSFSLSHIKDTFKSGADGFLLNSLIYSVFAATFGTLLAFICAYMTSRAKSGVSRALHLMSITSVAIPGLVLGLSYVIFFKSSFIYGTVFIIGFANAVHFFASPYLMMYNTLGKLNGELEAVGKTLGIKRIRIIVDVIVPKVRFTLYEMAVYFFVNSMMTISAVSLLAPPAPQPLSLMISRAESQIDIGKAATVSLLILIINLVIKLIITVINRVKNKIQN